MGPLEHICSFKLKVNTKINLTVLYENSFIFGKMIAHGVFMIMCYSDHQYDHGVKGQAQMSRDIKFSTMWYVRLAKAQISLRICAV